MQRITESADQRSGVRIVLPPWTGLSYLRNTWTGTAEEARTCEA